MNIYVQMQKTLFETGITRPISFRISQLKHLKKGIKKYEKEIVTALYKDLHKPEFEAYATEVGFVLDSIGNAIKNLSKWSKDQTVKTPFHQMGSKGFIRYEPYGVALIIAPFNYPFQLLIEPLVGAICAGNTAILKPSEFTPHTESVIVKLFEEFFEENYIAVVTGGREVTSALLEEKMDMIFFTGSVPVGKVVMAAASKHLTPVVLELGGKSPTIVHKDADIQVAARRIAWGKFMNAGQICIAPDYVYVHESVEEAFLKAIKAQIEHFYGENPLESPDYCKIVNQGHFDRLLKLIKPENVYCGGSYDTSSHRLAPTVMRGITWDDSVMKEEIFGPILPVLTYRTLEDCIEGIKHMPNPLACYIFSEDERVQDHLLTNLSFGGGCINDTISHVAVPDLPFGGLGNSGMGQYHGEASFKVFSHAKSILVKPTKRELMLPFPPYKKKAVIVKKILK